MKLIIEAYLSYLLDCCFLLVKNVYHGGALALSKHYFYFRIVFFVSIVEIECPEYYNLDRFHVCI